MRRMRTVTMGDLARATGKTVSTVSKALRGAENVAPETREEVLRAARELNYIPYRHGVAKPSVTQKAAVAIITAATGDGMISPLVARMRYHLDILGYAALPVSEALVLGGSVANINSIVNGLILTSPRIDSPIVDDAMARGVPTVLVGSTHRRGAFDVIEGDSRIGAAEAIRHLAASGHRRIGLLLGPRDLSASVARFEGAKAALQAHGLEHAPDLVIWGEATHQGGYSGFMQLMAQAARPTAAFCADDAIAIGALDAAHRLRIRVPDEVSLIGYGDIPASSWSFISLTTVREDIDEIAALAAARIAARIGRAEASPPSHSLVPTGLVVRGTVGPVCREGA